MFLRFVMLGISFVVILFTVDILLPKLRLKYRLHKEHKERKKKTRIIYKKDERIRD